MLCRLVLDCTNVRVFKYKREQAHIKDVTWCFNVVVVVWTAHLLYGLGRKLPHGILEELGQDVIQR